MERVQFELPTDNEPVRQIAAGDLVAGAKRTASVRPTGRMYLEVKVLYTPGKGKY